MSSPVPSPTRTVVALTLLFLADALAVGQGLVSLLTALAGLALLLAGALWAGLRRRGALARSRALRAALYLGLGLATVAALRFHTATANANAVTVIAACQRFRAAHGRFPERLEELAPAQLPRVPRARYTLLWGEFGYWSTGSPEAPAHVLVYTALPPFGRRTYDLERGAWGRLD